MEVFAVCIIQNIVPLKKKPQNINQAYSDKYKEPSISLFSLILKVIILYWENEVVITDTVISPSFLSQFVTDSGSDFSSIKCTHTSAFYITDSLLVHRSYH